MSHSRSVLEESFKTDPTRILSFEGSVSTVNEEQLGRRVCLDPCVVSYNGQDHIIDHLNFLVHQEIESAVMKGQFTVVQYGKRTNKKYGALLYKKASFTH